MPKPRKENSRVVRERILILCEGRETEPRYFNGIKTAKGRESPLTALRIEVYDTYISSGKELVQKAAELKQEAIAERNPYDTIWVVFDKDGYTKHPHAFDQARTKDIRIAFSSIAFEYWFLLHFTKTTKAFGKADDLIRYLKVEGHYPDYEKAKDHYQRLSHLTETAIKNAVWLRKQICYDAGRGDKCYDFNPYTDVDVLVRYLLSLQ